MKRFFITGIDTNVGKTICSAILTEALQADYWKPIQTGVVEGSDTSEIKKLISNAKTTCYKESYSFSAPVSPHLAAAIENETIVLDKIEIPITTNHLVIEGAGGLLVPLNKTHYVIDLAKQMDAEIILVIRNYLGCINHSLLSIAYLLNNNFKIKGLILNGNFDALVEDAILNYSSIPVVARIPNMDAVNKNAILELTHLVKKDILV